MKLLIEYKGFKANQLILDHNKTLARIIYFEIDDDYKAKYKVDIVLVRLGLINKKGFEFANSTASFEGISILPVNLKINFK